MTKIVKLLSCSKDDKVRIYAPEPYEAVVVSFRTDRSGNQTVLVRTKESLLELSPATACVILYRVQ